jgi:hypothetical protein
MGELEHKFEVEIKMTEDKQKLPVEIKEELKVSGMMTGQTSAQSLQATHLSGSM